MAEVIRRFEGSETDIEDETSAYERLLNKMFQIDEHLSLKTETINPIEMSRFSLISDLIEYEGLSMKDDKSEDSYLKEEADLLRNLEKYVKINFISKDRKGRWEGFEAIKSYNLGQIQNSLNDEETEKFKRIMKKMK
ncbi:MAG: hypothetical protein ACW981_21110 [Candidatus Hodarchaeales archaeon]